jgi:hypothetical protein
MGLRRVNYIWAAITMTRGQHADGQVASKKSWTALKPGSRRYRDNLDEDI